MKLLLLLILGMNLLVACNKASDTSLSETFGVETPAPATTEEEPEPEPVFLPFRDVHKVFLSHLLEIQV